VRSFEIGRRNLFGTNRSVNLFTSASLTRRHAGGHQRRRPCHRFGRLHRPIPCGRTVPGAARARIERRLPRDRNRRTADSLELQFHAASVAAELAVRLSKSMSASGGYQIQRTRVFDQNIDVRSSRTSIGCSRSTGCRPSWVADWRHPRRSCRPTRGRYFSQRPACRSCHRLGGRIREVVFTAQTFSTLPGRRAIVFAGARGSAWRTASTMRADSGTPASERFFAGGEHACAASPRSAGRSQRTAQ
jgi:hypothetical protein